MNHNIIEKPVPQWIFEDPMAILLLKSISNRPRLQQKKRETYAAAYVTDDKRILAIGRNMQVFKKEGWRVIQGYANHAEMMAYSTAALTNPSITGGIIYVIGFLAQNKVFIRKKTSSHSEQFTCKLCAKKACEHQINGIAIPTQESWKMFSAQQALETSIMFKKKNSNNSSGRKQERAHISAESTKKLSSFLKQTSPQTLIRMLENQFEISPLVVALTKLTESGYIDTTTFKQTVFQFKNTP